MTPHSDRTPLLPNGNGSEPAPSLLHRLKTIVEAEGEPSWLESYEFFLLGSWLNVFLIFVPLSIVAHNLNWDAALRFSFSFIAIIPLAKVRPIGIFQCGMKHADKATSCSVKLQSRCRPSLGRLWLVCSTRLLEMQWKSSSE
jgi:hypothetical protein